MEKFFQVGIISSTHGLKGEVKVFPTTDDIKRFEKLKSVILDNKKEHIDLEIEGIKYFKKFVILKFKGINNINDIEKYKGMSLLVARDNAIELEKDQYFIADMIGMEVVLEDDTYLGILVEVIVTGANDVYVVETDEKKEILIPAIKKCILETDIDRKRMKVHLLEGLLD